MNRLFVFGCSYTHYLWPTWADLLSVEFDEYQNWGYPGLGNRAIAERVAEAHLKNKFTKDDTVIIQWTTLLRHDWHNEKPINSSNPGWQTNGNAFCDKNVRFYSRDWYDKFYSERSWTMHTLNHISLVQELLSNIGCSWRMTSLSDIRTLGTDIEKDVWAYERVVLLDKEKEGDYILWKRYPDFLPYKSIWDDYQDKWLPPIMPESTKNDLYYWFQASHDKEPWKEAHPSPVQHQIWLNKHLRPSLELVLIPDKQQEIVDICNKLKEDPIYMDCIRFEKYLLNEKDNTIFPSLNWPNPKRGY